MTPVSKTHLSKATKRHDSNLNTRFFEDTKKCVATLSTGVPTSTTASSSVFWTSTTETPGLSSTLDGRGTRPENEGTSNHTEEMLEDGFPIDCTIFSPRFNEEDKEGAPNAFASFASNNPFGPCPTIVSCCVPFNNFQDSPQEDTPEYYERIDVLRCDSLEGHLWGFAESHISTHDDTLDPILHVPPHGDHEYEVESSEWIPQRSGVHPLRTYNIRPEMYRVPLPFERFMNSVSTINWSKGARLHRSGNCLPCSFFHRQGSCENGQECTFCHICPSDEGRRRKKMKSLLIKARKDMDRRNEDTSEPLSSV